MATAGCVSLTAAPAPLQPLGQMLTSTRPREDPPLSAQPLRKALKTPGQGERTSFFMKPKESRAPPLGSAPQASAATGAAEQSGAPQSGPTHSSCWLPACELNCASRYATPHRVSGRFGTVVVPAPPQAPHLLPPRSAAGTLLCLLRSRSSPSASSCSDHRAGLAVRGPLVSPELERQMRALPAVFADMLSSLDEAGSA